MEFAYDWLNCFIPDIAMELILACEPDSKWHEEQRRPDHITVWLKHSLRREIEHGTSKLIWRSSEVTGPRTTIRVLGSPCLRPIKETRVTTTAPSSLAEEVEEEA